MSLLAQYKDTAISRINSFQRGSDEQSTADCSPLTVKVDIINLFRLQHLIIRYLIAGTFLVNKIVILPLKNT